jgi:hypothetical protein
MASPTPSPMLALTPASTPATTPAPRSQPTHTPTPTLKPAPVPMPLSQTPTSAPASSPAPDSRHDQRPGRQPNKRSSAEGVPQKRASLTRTFAALAEDDGSTERRRARRRCSCFILCPSHEPEKRKAVFDRKMLPGFGKVLFALCFPPCIYFALLQHSTLYVQAIEQIRKTTAEYRSS